MSRLLLLALAIALALHAPPRIHAQKGRAPQLDRFGDPLPVGALARLGTIRFHRSSCAAYSPDGKLVATADSDEVNLWDIATSKRTRQLPVKGWSPCGLIFSHGGKKLAVVEWGGTSVQVWDLDTFNKVLLKQANGGSGGSDWSNAAAFSSDDKTLFVATSKATLFTTAPGSRVYVWEVATGQVVRRLEAASYLCSPDNRLLAGSSATLKLFDLYSGRLVRECKAEGSVLGNCAFSPDGKLLAASCSDTTILVWPTSAADGKAGMPLDEKGLADVLEKGKATDAYPAIGRMIADPERALSLLERRLQPVPKVDAKQIQRLIDDLDSDQANRREDAAKDLAQLGTLVEPALRAASSSERMPFRSKRRIERLLQDLDEKQTALSAEDVLHVRAVQALERIGTKRARQLLHNLAQGEQASPRTRAAVESLSRMEAR